MRPLALFGAVVLMLVAAYGLSPTLSTGDYCGVDRLERAWWPPGVHCRYMPSYERGSGPAEPDTANAFAFIATLVIGVAFVLARRSPLAFASALIFGFAGLGAAFPSNFHVLLLLGAAVGVLAAYWCTRSLVVSLLPAAALCVAFVAQFIGDVPLAWAGALAVLMLLPQRAEGFDRPPPALPRR